MRAVDLMRFALALTKNLPHRNPKGKIESKNFTLTVRPIEFLSKGNEKQKNQTWSTLSLQVISSQNGTPSKNMFYILYITFFDPLVLGDPSILGLCVLGFDI